MELRHPPAQALSGRGTGAAIAVPVRLALLAGPAAVGFASGGYFEDARLIAGIVAWALLAVLGMVVPRPLLPRSAVACWALLGLAGLLGWAALSRDWAPLAAPAGEDVQRDALYLAALGAAVLAWRPREWARAVEPALLLGILAACLYGLSERLLPGLFELRRSIAAAGRLNEPLTYWNAMGALAAMGLVLSARLAGDRTRPDALRALGAAAAPSVGVALYLAYSRGAFAAAGAGIVVLSLLAPTWAQLRATMLAGETAAVAAIVASRLDGVASLSGSHRGGDGAVMLVVLVAITIVAAAVQAYGCRVERDGRVALGPLPVAPRLRALGWLAAVAIAAVPFAIAIAQRDHRPPPVGAQAARLSSVGSNRYAYWRVAVRTFGHHPFKGAGTSSFGTEWLKHRPFGEAVRDAHSLELETAAELGIVGLALLGALLGGTALAARRTWLADPALATGPAAALVVWLVHSSLDWDWEVPGLTLVAISLAGLVLTRAREPADVA